MTMTPKNDKATLAGGSDVTANATTTPQFYTSRSENSPVVCNPREHRALVALLARDLSRESLDRIVGCSNAPDLVKRCRERYGLTLHCARTPAIDRDGNEIQFGIYRPDAADRRRIRQLLTRQAGFVTPSMAAWLAVIAAPAANCAAALVRFFGWA